MIKILNYLKYLVPFTIVLFSVQYILPEIFFKGKSFFYSVWSIHAFLFCSALVIYSTLVFVNNNLSDKTGFTFLALTVIKMFASVLFLIPLIQANLKEVSLDVASFFIPYFMYLFFETFFAIRLIKRSL